MNTNTPVLQFPSDKIKNDRTVFLSPGTDSRDYGTMRVTDHRYNRLGIVQRDILIIQKNFDDGDLRPSALVFAECPSFGKILCFPAELSGAEEIKGIVLGYQRWFDPYAGF